MGRNRELGHQTVRVLKALEAGCRYGFEVIQLTGNHSATVYRALRSLEKQGLVKSAWEKAEVSEDSGRPRRRYYKMTRQGRKALDEALATFEEIRALDRRPGGLGKLRESEG